MLKSKKQLMTKFKITSQQQYHSKTNQELQLMQKMSLWQGCHPNFKKSILLKTSN
jgi:hypothetical protein